MSTTKKTTITIEAIVHAPIVKIWQYWSEPKHIIKWNNASDDWHTPQAQNNLKVGGIFNYRMEAKDGSLGFDFGGTYDEVQMNKRIAYTIGDGRKVQITFAANGNQTKIIETFEAETAHPVDLQKNGWQAILNNFKKYAEAH